MDNVNERPRVLIEDWLPVNELGVESRRERASASSLPPLSFLHVWWARRPLVASATVVLAGVLPAWTDRVGSLIQTKINTFSPEIQRSILSPRPALRPRVTYSEATEAWYHDWVLHLAGVWGDPVLSQTLMAKAKATGARSTGFNYKQAFRNSPDKASLALLRFILTDAWSEMPLVLDSTAGGGSIPFTAVNLGLPTVANDLNSVAAAILMAGVKAPAEHGLELIEPLRFWGSELVDRISRRLAVYYPKKAGEDIIAYIWAHTVRCPRTGQVVPLVTDWWLRKTPGKEVAVHLVTKDATGPATFEIVRGRAACAFADRGTVSGGNAVSPYDDLVIDGKYIKAEAQAGRMGYVAYAVSVRTPAGERDFRVPEANELAAIDSATHDLRQSRAKLEADGFIPTESIPDPSNYERGHRLYGIYRWADMFTERQLLAHAVFAQEYAGLIPEIAAADAQRAPVLLALLAMMQGKALNWNARASSWDVSRQKVRSFFDKHNFSFKWSFAEFEGTALFHWALDQLLDAYSGIAKLLDDSETISELGGTYTERRVSVTQGNAADLATVPDGSVAHYCVDPPYYNNVMYAELSDFFYVWEKRTLGRALPSFFRDELTDKENEAVANEARFAQFGARKKELANADYEAKMTAIFAEAHRVLRDDGVMTVMFTHKRAEAWDTLGTALLQSGFTVETSWPVNTESEYSLHQARVNAAASTIMLVCRKRQPVRHSGQTFFDDIESDVRREARLAVERFESAGLTGVDLLLATYGPALSVISAAWPVYSSHASTDGSARLLRPEEALDAARTEVVRLQRSRLVGRASKLDALTDFVLIAWDTFKAHEFPFDDARRLALAVGGLDIEELKRAKIVDAKSGTVRLLEPRERVRREDGDSPGVRPLASSFGSVIDAVDTVMYVADVDGLPAAKALMDRLGLTKDTGFLAGVQGLVNAIPRVRVKGEWTAPEADMLDRLVGAFLSESVTLPPVVDPSVTEPERLF